MYEALRHSFPINTLDQLLASSKRMSKRSYCQLLAESVECCVCVHRDDEDADDVKQVAMRSYILCYPLLLGILMKFADVSQRWGAPHLTFLTFIGNACGFALHL